MTLSQEAALHKDSHDSHKTSGLSALQHRHYAAIGGIIASLEIDVDTDELTNPTAFITGAIARHFADHLSANPRFNRERFLRACGVRMV